MTRLQMCDSRQESGVSEPSNLTGQPVKSAGESRPSPDASASVLPERFAVEVTVDDILHGESCISDTCPVALAIKRWLRSQNVAFVSVNVTSSDMFIRLNWRTPMQRYWYDGIGFIFAFDRGEPVEPRTVVLARLPRTVVPARLS